MKRLTRYDCLTLLMLLLLSLSLFSRASAEQERRESMESVTLSLLFREEAPPEGEALYWGDYCLGIPRLEEEKRATLTLRGRRLSGGFFLEGEMWLGANLSLSLLCDGEYYSALTLAVRPDSEDFSKIS